MTPEQARQLLPRTPVRINIPGPHQRDEESATFVDLKGSELVVDQVNYDRRLELPPERVSLDSSNPRQRTLTRMEIFLGHLKK